MHPGRGKRLGGLAGGLVLMASVVLLMIGFWPQAVRSRILHFGEGTSSSAQSGSTPFLTSPRSLHLVWPAFIRLGDSGVIRMTFNPVGRADLPPGKGSPNGVAPPNAPVLVEARLEMTGLEVDPLGTVSMPMTTGQGLGFSWTVRPSLPGDYRGMVWLSLRSIQQPSGPGMERALAAIPIDIRIFSLLGFGTEPLRILGVAGILVGLILIACSWKPSDGGGVSFQCQPESVMTKIT